MCYFMCFYILTFNESAIHLLLFAYLLRTMSSTTDISASFSESAEAKRERRLQRRRERKSLLCIGNSQTTEERLTSRRIRDRARHTAQTVEQRQALLQVRRERLAAESPEQREARLQYRRDHLATESPEPREARLQCSRESRTTGEQTSQLFKQHSVEVHTPFCVELTSLDVVNLSKNQ